MKIVFETLRELRLDQEHLSQTLGRMDARAANEVVEKLSSAIDSGNKPLQYDEHSLFNFVANDSLSGGLSGCEGLSCRISRGTELAQFAALYADRVLVRNPLEKYQTSHTIDKFDYRLRELLHGDLALLWEFRPLLEQGIVGFSKSVYHFCTECFRRYSGSNGFDYAEKLEKAENFILKELQQKMRIEVVTDEDGVHVEFSGPEALVEHQGRIVAFARDVPVELRKYLDRIGKKTLNNSGTAATMLFKEFFSSNLADFAMQDWYAKNFDFVYLTNRPLDAGLIQKLNSATFRERNSNLVPGLKHTVPALEGAPIEAILNLRNAHREEFQDYRLELRNVMKTMQLNTRKEAREAFLDLVRPKVESIERSISEFRKQAAKDLGLDVVIYSGLVAIGLHAGILPSNIAELVAAIGGIELAHSALRTAALSTMRPAEQRRNPYYFLWRLNRQLRKNAGSD